MFRPDARTNPSPVFSRPHTLRPTILRPRVLLLCALLQCSLLQCVLGTAQTPPPPIDPQAVPSRPEAVPEERPLPVPSFTFKAITRLVVLDVVARDSEDNPVEDLTEKDFQITERTGPSQNSAQQDLTKQGLPQQGLPQQSLSQHELPQHISYFRIVQNSSTQKSAASGGIRLTAPLPVAFCPSKHYELSYYLSGESQKEGSHFITVKSARPDLRLYFRRSYEIETADPGKRTAADIEDLRATASLPGPDALKAEEKQPPALATIACYDTLNITSLPLSVRKTESKDADLLEYEFLAGGKSLNLPAAPDHTYLLHLDLAICTFDSGGHPLRYFERSIEQPLDESQRRSVVADGFRQTIKLASEGAYSARLVLRDPATGALGSAELQILQPFSQRVRIPKREGTQPPSSFGTVTPVVTGLCGDVYQLAPWTVHVPRFSELEPIGAVYTPALAVYTPFFTEGIPSLTSRTEWFGINYQGSFWVDEPEEFQFELIADDGAKLYVDRRLVIDNDNLHPSQSARGKIRLKTGEHSIRVAYFQGTRTEVALVVSVKTGHKWRLFDTADFPRPEGTPQHGRKLPHPKIDDPPEKD